MFGRKKKERETSLATASSTIAALEAELALVKRGDFTLPGESIPTIELVRVLREELDCTHDELRRLKDNVKAIYKLLEPQLGD